MKIKDFTPAFDSIMKKHDALTALVYGRIWRFAQGELGKSTASIATLASKLGMSEATVKRRIYLLLEDGYIKKVGGGKEFGAPSEYVPTGKAYLEFGISAVDELEGGSSQRDTQVAHKDTRGSSQRATKKEVKKQNKKEENTSEALASGKSDQDALRKRAQDYFQNITKLPLPKKKGEQTSQWFSPIREICELGGWKPDLVQKLIREGIQRNRDSKLSIYSPNSILKNVRASVADLEQDVDFEDVVAQNKQRAREAMGQ